MKLTPPRWMTQTQAKAFDAVIASLSECVPAVTDNKILSRFAELTVISSDPLLSRRLADQLAAEMHLLRIGLVRQNAEAVRNG